MTAERFQRVEALFNAAITQPQDRRAEFLAANEADPDIRADVLRLLDHAHASGSHPLAARLRDIGVRASAMPERIGPYRLLRQIGEGGMGGVFLAERHVEGVVQRVALKLLHGIATEGGKRRMARERELLAGLNHPHIASLIDGGLTGDGQPYLVMDYVEGTTLAEYLVARRPTLADRVRLHLQCCDAVQHAHQRLVLHRDIKPSNIIVGIDGTPVLLDFGVGKLLATGASDAHTVTLAFTPGYAAPEQLHGEAATTATDVFGLGALLFDILTGQRLSALRKGDAPVPPPSAQTADPARRRELRGDLDRIVMKATAPAPEQRYATAAALADDLRRYLLGEPIAAAPDAFGYRLRKFVTRHRWAVAAGLAVAVGIGAFMWRLDAERQRALLAEQAAIRAARQAEASRDFLVSMLAATDPDVMQGKPATISLFLAAMADKLRYERKQDPMTLAVAWLTVSEAYRSLNDHPLPSLYAADAAAAFLRQAGNTNPDLYARVHRTRGAVLAQLRRFPEAKQALQALIDVRARQGADAKTLAQAHYNYAVVARAGGEHDEASRYLVRAVALLKAHEDPDTARLRLNALLAIADTELQRNRAGQARACVAQARGIAERALAANDDAWNDLRRLEAATRSAPAPAAPAVCD